MLNNLLNQMGGLSNMMNQFNQFRSSFNGNPQQQVQNLLNSGQMTQQQFNELQAAAKQFLSITQR